MLEKGALGQLGAAMESGEDEPWDSQTPSAQNPLSMAEQDLGQAGCPGPTEPPAALRIGTP